VVLLSDAHQILFRGRELHTLQHLLDGLVDLLGCRFAQFIQGLVILLATSLVSLTAGNPLEGSKAAPTSWRNRHVRSGPQDQYHHNLPHVPARTTGSVSGCALLEGGSSPREYVSITLEPVLWNGRHNGHRMKHIAHDSIGTLIHSGCGIGAHDGSV
jgi:hypothetical protein